MTRNSTPPRIDFNPNLTPWQMLKLGVFNGRYFPEFEFLREFGHRRSLMVCDRNLFQVEASSSWENWASSGWIHPQDPLGWFQWYTRYHLGRRSDDDARQISRWKGFVRHYLQVQNSGNGDLDSRLRQRQALLPWAYDPCPDIQLKDVNTYDKLRLLIPQS